VRSKSLRNRNDALPLYADIVQASLCYLQTSLNCLPVDHIPDSTEVLSLSVLVLQVVCVLPSINTQQWCVLSNNRVLVGICADLNLSSLVVLDEPCPSTTLDTCKGCVELGLEGGEIAVAGFDSGLL